MKIFWFVIIIPFSTSFLYSFTGIYPIAAPTQNNIYCMYQTSPHSIHFVEYEADTGQVNALLSSQFNPTLVRMMPDNKAFSFIDNGIIKVKEFFKRSAQSIEILDPVYNITGIEWINNNDCFINAQYNNRFGIFQLDRNGNVTPIIFSSEAEFLCLQKHGDSLFFIERSIDKSQKQYRVLKLKFEAKNNTMHHDLKSWQKNNVEKFNCEQCEYIGQKVDDKSEKGIFTVPDTVNNEIIPIADFDVRPALFLIMNSEREGFVVEYCMSTNKNSRVNSRVLHFALHHITQKLDDPSPDLLNFRTALFDNQPYDKWNSHHLFNFVIPLELVAHESEQALYERMNPLLPKKIGNYIYYVSGTYANDTSEEIEQENSYSNLNLFRYDLSLAVTEQLTHAKQKGEHYLCPLLVGNIIYGGKSLLDQQSCELVCLDL